MNGACRTAGSCASGTRFDAAPFAGIHWIAPPGLLDCTHSNANRLSRYCVVNAIGLDDQAPSRPLVTVSSPLPVPHLFCQPRPCCSIPAAAGGGAPHLEGAWGPRALSQESPPAR